ncbi:MULTISPECIES: lipoyl(octanoyl) transferase LipB [Rhodomicrobium]|uniref:lipoyl(octanoyl) transferase LipB n=1 Tax=Rhodomicrobium sp. R_RK_3 TaxID=2029567 RepID=UPI000B4BE178|nr:MULTISPECIES: lipoyl(octanoyl) transferase LipB [Rhodomicrobium]
MAWATSREPVPYEDAVAAMERRVDAIHRGEEGELVWLLQHPPLYTAGTSAKPEDLLDAQGLPVFQTGRGGQFTYHGPGQRIAYLMLDLSRRGKDVRRFVRDIERWVIDALGGLGVDATCRTGRTGIWVPRPEKGPLAEDKIAAIGIRVRRWVSFHGVSINVDPELTHYDGIVACGIRDQGVTSLTDLGKNASMDDLDTALASAFSRHFGSRAAPDPELDLNSPSSHPENVPL